MARKLAGRVVVITGASSGIGRASALHFARRGAKLVLAARREPALEDVADECEALGTSAIVVSTDVRDEAAVKQLAGRAVDAFGRLDVWVNNAGVFMLGRFDKVPPDAFRQLVETNFFGCVHGARAAIPCLRVCGGGVIINVASMAATMGIPNESAYASSKWAVRGFSESLRHELRDEKIDVVTVLPASIDTPLFQHAANFTGKAIKPTDPVYPPARVARAIVASARRPRSEVFVGAIPQASRVLRTFLPTTVFERMVARRSERNHFLNLPAENSPGNLAQPRVPYAVDGGWLAGNGKIRLGRLVVAGVVLAAAVPAAMALGRAQRRERILSALLG